MARLTVVTWLWGMKYGREYVDRLERGLRRHLPPPWRFVVITDDATARGLRQTAWDIPKQDYALLALPGCLARLRLFDPAWQMEKNIHAGDRVVCLDLDLIVTAPLGSLFRRSEPFIILAGANASNPCPYNGSVFSLLGGAHPEVWTDFSVAAARAIPFDAFPDDQAWFAHKLPRAATWRVGASSGIYAFQKPGWPGGDALPADARIVAFPGKRDPSRHQDLPWVREHWR